MKIVSGGQTGVDRAALDVAIQYQIQCGGWCPKGRIAQDGAIDPKYPLQETPSGDYIQRTSWNVRDSDGTLILAFGDALTGGTLFTRDIAVKLQKPVFQIDLTKEILREPFDLWIQMNKIQTLNVAGPREISKMNLVYKAAFETLKLLLKEHE